MTVTSLMEDLKFGKGEGIEDLIELGVRPLREYAGMVA